MRTPQMPASPLYSQQARGRMPTEEAWGYGSATADGLPLSSQCQGGGSWGGGLGASRMGGGGMDPSIIKAQSQAHFADDGFDANGPALSSQFPEREGGGVDVKEPGPAPPPPPPWEGDKFARGPFRNGTISPSFCRNPEARCYLEGALDGTKHIFCPSPPPGTPLHVSEFAASGEGGGAEERPRPPEGTSRTDMRDGRAQYIRWGNIARHKTCFKTLAKGVPTLDRDLPKGVPTLDRDLPKGVPTLDRDLPKGVPTLDRDLPKGVPTLDRDLPKGVPTLDRDLPKGVPTLDRDLPKGVPMLDREVAGGGLGLVCTFFMAMHLCPC